MFARRPRQSILTIAMPTIIAVAGTLNQVQGKFAITAGVAMNITGMNIVVAGYAMFTR